MPVHHSPMCVHIQGIKSQWVVRERAAGQGCVTPYSRGCVERSTQGGAFQEYQAVIRTEAQLPPDFMLADFKFAAFVCDLPLYAHLQAHTQHAHTPDVCILHECTDRLHVLCMRTSDKHTQ